MDLFQFNGLTKKALRGKESDMFPLLSSTMTTPAKGIFSTSFEVDSFSSIANGCTSFGNQQLATGLPLNHKGVPGLRGRKIGDRKEFLVKLDHEGVTSPKTKNGKALLLLGNPEVQRGGRMEKGFGAKGVGELTSTMGYSQSILLVKDAKRNSCHIVKGSSDMRKHPQGLGLSEYADYGPNCHSDCLSSYSDMDEDEDEEDDARRAAMRSNGRFLSRLSVSSSSSGSSSASSSGSLSSSSICSSDNDSSYSSDEEEASRLLLQGCLSSHHTLLQQQQHPEPPTSQPRHTFGAKTITIPNSKAAVNSSTGKPPRRKEIANNSSSVVQSKSSKDFPKKQKIPSSEGPPNSSSFMPGRQLWRWSGNPTQVISCSVFSILIPIQNGFSWGKSPLNFTFFSTETGFERKSPKALLQGHRSGQRHRPSWRLCSFPFCWSTPPPLHWSHRESMGILVQQHGSQSKVVLPP